MWWAKLDKSIPADRIFNDIENFTQLVVGAVNRLLPNDCDFSDSVQVFQDKANQMINDGDSYNKVMMDYKKSIIALISEKTAMEYWSKKSEYEEILEQRRRLFDNYDEKQKAILQGLQKQTSTIHKACQKSLDKMSNYEL